MGEPQRRGIQFITPSTEERRRPEMQRNSYQVIFRRRRLIFIPQKPSFMPSISPGVPSGLIYLSIYNLVIPPGGPGGLCCRGGARRLARLPIAIRLPNGSTRSRRLSERRQAIRKRRGGEGRKRFSLPTSVGINPPLFSPAPRRGRGGCGRVGSGGGGGSLCLDVLITPLVSLDRKGKGRRL